MFKEIIKRIVPKKYHEAIYKNITSRLGNYSERFYSQEGEDMVLRKYVSNIDNGFYVDVGAHHPYRFSNTFYFYKKGWCGINIDAMPGSMKLFKKKRPRDINLEIAVSEKKEKLMYYAFNEPALNGFSNNLSRERDGKKNYKIIFKKEIETITLSEILDEYLPSGKHIDFMSIDVEGLDFNVLTSNNWEKYRPSFLLVEILNINVSELPTDKVYSFIVNKGYAMIAKTGNTVIFRDTKV